MQTYLKNGCIVTMGADETVYDGGGVLASSVGHDNHNIIVMGDSFEDMALAVNRCAELAAQKKALNAVAYEMGTPIQIPFMFLCFICLACIEAYAVTDKGFIDVEKGEIIDPILGVVE